MSRVRLFLILILAALVGGGAASVTTRYFLQGTSTAPVRESAYARVMRTGTLRCGYIVFPGLFARDPNTGVFSGPIVDILQEMGKQLSLKVEWTEEIGFSNAFEGLKSGRYDAACFLFTQTPGRARANEFTEPVVFMPYNLYSRADDTRFDHAFAKINDSSVKVVVLEGEMSQTVRAEEFPNATPWALTNLTDASQVLLDVSLGKADVAMTVSPSAFLFMQKNSGKIRRVEGPPLRMQPGSFGVGVGEEELKSLLNTTITALHNTGFIERTFHHHAAEPGMFFFPATPWKAAGAGS